MPNCPECNKNIENLHYEEKHFFCPICMKSIAENINDAEIKYLSAGKYILKTESDDVKIADNKLKEIIKNIEKKSKQQGVEFKIKEK